MAMSAQSRRPQNLPEEDLESLVNDTVRYILGNVPLTFPVKRQEIVKNVLKDHSKSFKVVMERSRTCLKQDYGIDIVEVSASPSNKVYLLINDFKYKNLPNLRKFLPEKTKAQQILLLIVASFIFMKGGSVKEDTLWDFLVRLNLYKKDKTFVHEYYGDVYKAVQDFVRQMYLDYVRVPNIEPPRHDFTLGKRAELEVSYRILLEFMGHVYGSRNLQSWHTQYQAVLQQEHRWRERRIAGGEPISSEPSQFESSEPELPSVSQREPSWASQPGPSWASEPGPSWASQPGPSWASQPGPSCASQPGPSWASQPGPSWASQPGPSCASQTGPPRASQPRPSCSSQEPQPGPSGYQSQGTILDNVDSSFLQPANVSQTRQSQTRQRTKITIGSSKRLRKL